MVDPKRNTAGDAPRQTAAQPASAGSKEIGEALLAMHKDYVRAVQEIMARAQQRCSQAQFDYMRVLYEAQLNVQKAQEAAYRGYVAGVQDACNQGNAQGLAREVEQRYVKDVEAGQSQVRQSLEDASRAASTAIQGANDEASKAWEQARIDYLKGLRDQFARVDPQSLQPDVIALIGQSLLAAAQYAPRPQSA